ncbi:hypothetical protein F7725_018737, partial [Dissostichus mawsoni]
MQGATCSTAIIGIDGTATISRKRRGTVRGKRGSESERKGERDDCDEQRGSERERDGQRGNKLERGQRSQTSGDKASCQTLKPPRSSSYRKLGLLRERDERARGGGRR